MIEQNSTQLGAALNDSWDDHQLVRGLRRQSSQLLAALWFAEERARSSAAHVAQLDDYVQSYDGAVGAAASQKSGRTVYARNEAVATSTEAT